MKACTRCVRLHLDAEAAEGRRLSCTEVKRFWMTIREEHRRLYGHPPAPTLREDGIRICDRCKRLL